MTTQIHHRTATVKGLKVFYREAGDPTSPTILLPHGLPTSSQMFRDLIPALADAPEAPIGWSYRQPCPEVAAIADHVAFYQETVTIVLAAADAERV